MTMKKIVMIPMYILLLVFLRQAASGKITNYKFEEVMKAI